MELAHTITSDGYIEFRIKLPTGGCLLSQEFCALVGVITNISPDGTEFVIHSEQSQEFSMAAANRPIN
jgi:hypothetical protein